MMPNGKGKCFRDRRHLLFSPHRRSLIVQPVRTKAGSRRDSSNASQAASHVPLLYSVKTSCDVHRFVRAFRDSRVVGLVRVYVFVEVNQAALVFDQNPIVGDLRMFDLLNYVSGPPLHGNDDYLCRMC